MGPDGDCGSGKGVFPLGGSRLFRHRLCRRGRGLLQARTVLVVVGYFFADQPRPDRLAMHFGAEHVVPGRFRLGLDLQDHFGRRGNRRNPIENDLARADAMRLAVGADRFHAVGEIGQHFHVLGGLGAAVANVKFVARVGADRHGAFRSFTSKRRSAMASTRVIASAAATRSSSAAGSDFQAIGAGEGQRTLHLQYPLFARRQLLEVQSHLAAVGGGFQDRSRRCRR